MFVIILENDKGEKKPWEKDGKVMRYQDIDDAIKLCRGFHHKRFRAGRAKVARLPETA